MRRVCRICGGKNMGQSLCSLHYQRMREHGDPLADVFPNKGHECGETDCHRASYCQRLCQMHYMRRYQRARAAAKRSLEAVARA